MHDWNVVVTTRERGAKMARRFLDELGPVDRTRYRGLLVMRVNDVSRFLAEVRGLMERHPELKAAVGHVTPVTETFEFSSPEDFEKIAKERIAVYASRLAGKKFHVRMHRRGFRGSLRSPDEERLLDSTLLQRLKERDRPGTIDFEDPDAVLVVETIDRRAGISLWTRDDRAQFPLLALD